MKVVFVGTGEIGLPSLQWLMDAPEVELLAVVCQPDKPVGRKQRPIPPVTKVLAEQNGIDVRQPRRIRHDAGWFQAVGPDLVVVLAYGQILPAGILNSPRLACLNLHASILPRHRGASPIQAAIREGDRESGITVIYMDEGLDTGAILLIRSLELAPGETGGTLHDRLAKLAPDALAEAVSRLANGTAPRIPQNHALATHCGKLGRNDGRIDWSMPADRIERLVRAYHPWPGTSAILSNPGHPSRLIKVFPPVEIVTAILEHPPTPGKFVQTNNDSWVVATGGQAVQIREIQPEGKRRMSVNAFMKGNEITGECRFAER